MKLFLLLVIFELSIWNCQAADRVYIPIGSAKTKKSVLALPSTRIWSLDGSITPEAQRAAHMVNDTLRNDLSFMDIFSFVHPEAYLEKPAEAGIGPGTFKIMDWSVIGTDFLLKTRLIVSGGDGENANAGIDAYLYEAASGKLIFSRHYPANRSSLRTAAHVLADQTVEALTGLPGIFLTRFTLSCDRTQKKEIYVMDYDGTNVKQITHHGSTSISPAWSPDGEKIAYSVYVRDSENVKLLDLKEFNLANDTIRTLSSRPGESTGAAYSPDGSTIALTLTYKGNPDIYLLDPTNGSVKRVTRSLGTDVDPAWSPDGKELVFTSTRAGKPMIYRMKLPTGNSGSSQAQRLTFAGEYNASPSWSPQDNKIAFASWIDGHADIFLMNPDGSHIERLTQNQGSNENPHFSPDGNFIAFDSDREGHRDIYVMNVDGTFVKRLTYGMGNCATPAWSATPPTSIIPVNLETQESQPAAGPSSSPTPEVTPSTIPTAIPSP